MIDTMERKNILIIGAGINQVPIIQTAKRLGYRVITVSPHGDYPGLDIADEVYHEDVLNKEAILEFAKTKQIGGVISDQSDMIAPTVAYLAEQLNLPGFGYENALKFTNKTLMRKTCAEVGLPTIPNCQAKSLNEALLHAEKIGYPVVIKPEDSYSSKGVVRIDSSADLLQKYEISACASKTGNVIVEKMIVGPQFFSQGFVDEYQLTMFAFSDRYYFDLPDLFLPYTNAFPTKASKRMQQRMADDFGKIIDRLKPKFGHVWAEWIYEETTDTLYMIEMAIRGAGAFVTTDVIPRAYGIDTQPYLIESAMGHGPVGFSTKDCTSGAAAFYCFLLPYGTVTAVEGLDKLQEIPGVVRTNIGEIRVGDKTKELADKNSRYGPIIVEGKTRDDLDQIRARMIETLKIRVMTKDGEREVIWE